MKKVRLESGLISFHYSQAEQEQTWKELSTDVSHKPYEVQYTPQDNLQYYEGEETQLGTDKYKRTIKANGREKTITYNVCNQQAKTYKTVRELYNTKVA